jgi:hypothetical protein
VLDGQSKDRSNPATWGWLILVVVAGLIALNGIAWLFVGPDAVVSDMSENIGVSVADFESMYPAAVEDITANQRQVAVWMMAIGAMGILAALAGHRERARWPWRITWVLVATPTGIAATGLGVAEAGGFVYSMLLLALVALTGQLLAGRRPS